MERRQILMAAGAIALVLAGLPAQAQDHFAGKTITVVLSVPAGSGGDLHGRLTARYMEKHIPGNPTIIANNRPGARGAIGVNSVYDSGDTDGTTLFYGSWNAPAVLEGAEGFNYVPENMGVVGSAGSDLSVVVRRDVVPDHEALGSVEELLIGGRGATNDIEVLGNLSLRVLDVPFRYVGGFGGFSAIQASIKAGEIQGGHAGLPGWINFFGPDSPDAWAVYYHPLFDSDGNPRPKTPGAYTDDTLSLVEVHNILHGTDPSGPWWEAYKWHQSNIMAATTVILSPPGVDEAILEILQTAFQAVAQDPEFLAEYEAMIGTPPPFNATEETKRIFRDYRNAPAEVTAAIEEISAL